MPARHALQIIAAALLISPTALAGDTNPPPGSVAPTMKTLDEAEPRIPVNAANTPGAAGALFSISNPGSYYLTGNIDAPAGNYAIFIDASNVTLDLMGFTIDGTNAGPARDAIQGDGSVTNITIQNGNVTNWSNMGINFEETSDTHVHNVRVLNPATFAIFCADDATITNCTLRNANTGILAGNRATIADTTVTDCSNAIETGLDASIRRCTISTATLDGIDADDRAAIHACTITGANLAIRVGDEARITDCSINANDDGIRTQDHALISACNISDNTGFGINAMGTGCTIENTTADANGTVGIFNSGFQAAIIDCTTRGNQTGISTGVDCSVIRCHACQNTTGINTLGDNLIDSCLVADNQTGISAGLASRVVNNAAHNNGTGITTNGASHIEANTVSDSGGTAIQCTGSGALVIKNRVSASGGFDYDLGSSAFGPIIDLSAGGDASAVTGADHPLANIIY